MVKKKVLGNPDDVSLERPKGSDDEEEDYEVADLSSIPTPKIEFVMPNLTPMEGAKKKLPKKVKEPKKTTSSSSSSSTLTGEQLNIEIVNLRPVVDKSRKFLAQRLVRKMKHMEAILSKKPSDALKRKVERFEEEIHYLKKIKKDEVSKFALLNKKDLDHLGITDKTPVKERCLYKLACEPHVVKAVEQYREKYPSWETTTAFLLQRLGLQYASMKDRKEELASASDDEEDESEEKDLQASKAKLQGKETTENDGKKSKAKKIPSVEKESAKISEDDDDNEKERESEDEERADSAGDSEDDDKIVSDDEGQIGSGSDDDEEAAAERRRELLLGSVNNERVVKKKTVPKKSAPVRRKAARKLSESETSTTAVIKKVKLGKEGKIKLGKRPATDDDRLQREDVAKAAKAESDSFFLPASSSVSAKEDATNSTKEEVISPKENQKVRESGKRISLPTTKVLKVKKNLAVLKPKKKLASVPRKKEKPTADSHQSSQKPDSAAENLHPSWAAKRLAKERQMAAPQSKRIVFDED